MAERRPVRWTRSLVAGAFVAIWLGACAGNEPRPTASPTNPTAAPTAPTAPTADTITTSSAEPAPTSTTGADDRIRASTSTTPPPPDPLLAEVETAFRRAGVARAYPLPVGVNSSYAREHHDYPAADIFAACGTPVLAPVTGVVDELSTTDRWERSVNDPTTRGGRFVSIVGEDSVRYYLAHLEQVAEGLAVGRTVIAGEAIGLLGRTGNAGACHIHFGLSPACTTGEWWVRRGVVWPWPYLDEWKAGTGGSPVLEIDEWEAAFGEACADPAALPWPAR